MSQKSIKVILTIWIYKPKPTLRLQLRLLTPLKERLFGRLKDAITGKVDVQKEKEKESTIVTVTSNNKDKSKHKTIDISNIKLK